jgi:hypothetical protein
MYMIQVSFDNVCRVFRNGKLLTRTRGKDKADAVKEARRQVRLARHSGF